MTNHEWAIRKAHMHAENTIDTAREVMRLIAAGDSDGAFVRAVAGDIRRTDINRLPNPDAPSVRVIARLTTGPPVRAIRGGEGSP